MNNFVVPPGYNPNLTEQEFKTGLRIEEIMRQEGEKHRRERQDREYIQPLQVMDFNWILSQTPSPKKFLIQDILPSKGLHILLGANKLGKSWLCLQWAYSLSAGNHVLGKIPVGKTKVLYIDLEETWELVHERAKFLNLQPLQSNELTICTTCPPNNLKALLQYVSTQGVGLVIIDTMQKFLNIKDLNDYPQTVAALAPLKELADQLDISILLIHHTRKGNGSEDWTSDGLGSTGITASCDTILKLGRKRGESRAELNITGRSCLEKNFVLSFDRDCGSWTLDGDKAEVMDGDTQQLIYDWLKGNGANGPTAIFKGIKEEGYDGTLSTIKNILPRMAKSGKLDNMSGVYLIPLDSIDHKNTKVYIDPIDPIDQKEKEPEQRSTESIQSIPVSGSIPNLHKPEEEPEIW